MHKHYLGPGPQGGWVHGNKVQKPLLVQNNWSGRQGFVVVVGGWKSGLAVTDRCGWEDHVEHIGCATVGLAEDDFAGAPGVGYERAKHVAEPAAAGPDVDGSGVDAAGKTVGWVKQMLRCEQMIIATDVSVVKQMWEWDDERQ